MEIRERLVPARDLRVSIRQELARADRSNSDLSVVILRVFSAARSERTRHRVASSAARMLRASDTVGWYDSKHFAILLPDTRSDGAEKLLTRLNGSLQLRPRVSECWVLSYPQTSNFEQAIANYVRVAS